MNRELDMKAVTAELIGTFVLVFIGTATAVFAGSGISGPEAVWASWQ